MFHLWMRNLRSSEFFHSKCALKTSEWEILCIGSHGCLCIVYNNSFARMISGYYCILFIPTRFLYWLWHTGITPIAWLTFLTFCYLAINWLGSFAKTLVGGENLFVRTQPIPASVQNSLFSWRNEPVQWTEKHSHKLASLKTAKVIAHDHSTEWETL